MKYNKLFPASGILKTRKHNVSETETESVSILRGVGETSTLLRPLEKGNFNLSKGSNREGVSSSPEDGNKSSF
jgi:hypothetical protein